MEKSILQQLFEGEICPSEQIKLIAPQHLEMSKKLYDMKDKFVKSLSRSDQKIYEDIEDLECEIQAVYHYEHFSKGYKIGVALMLETLYG